MSNINQIIDLVKNNSGIDKVKSDSDIFELGIVGDDFHELIDEYSKIYEVDMTGYLWYFHSDEEGQSLGALFVKPRNLIVKRIPITPMLLSKFAKTKKWQIKYPKHKLPDKRIDIKINQILVIAFIIAALSIWILK